MDVAIIHAYCSCSPQMMKYVYSDIKESRGDPGGLSPTMEPFVLVHVGVKQ